MESEPVNSNSNLGSGPFFLALIDPLNNQFIPPEHAHKMYHIRRNLPQDVAKKLEQNKRSKPCGNFKVHPMFRLW